MQTISGEWIEEQRARKYCRMPDLRIRSPEEALDFVNRVGFCHFWPIKGAELPNLFQAIAGATRDVPMEHDDLDVNRSWAWKDEALGQRRWYYGKLLYRRATMVSLDLLPTFYACSDNLGDVEEYLDEYRAGQMSAEAKWIYEALLEHGPLHTIDLRQRAGLSSSTAKSRFDRGLTELQTGLKVLPVGVARAGHWKYAFTYDILQRHFPDLVGVARELRRSQAQRILVSRYLDSVIAADRAMVTRMFRVLKWTPTELTTVIAALLDQGAVQEVKVSGLPHSQLVPVGALGRAA